MGKKKYDSWSAIADEAVLSKSFLKNPFNVLLSFVKKIEDFTPEMKEDLATLMMARMSFVLEQDKDNRFIKLVLQNDCFNFQRNNGIRFICDGIDKRISFNTRYILREDKFAEKRIDEINKCLVVLEKLKDTNIFKSINRSDIPFISNKQKFPISEKMIDMLSKMKEVFSLSVNDWKEIDDLVYSELAKGLLRQDVSKGNNIAALIKCQEKNFEENVLSYINAKISNYHLTIPKKSLYELYRLNESKDKQGHNSNLIKIIENAEKGSENNIEISRDSLKQTLDINITQLAYLFENSPENAGKSIVRFNENIGNTDEENKNGFLNLSSFIERFSFNFDMEKFTWILTVHFKKIEGIDVSFNEAANLFETELRKCWDKYHKEKINVENYSIDGKSIIEKYLMEKDVIMLNNEIAPTVKKSKKVIKF